MDEISKNKALEITREVLNRAGFEADVKFVDGDDSFMGKLPVISVESDKDVSMLIGKNGQNLMALEHVIKVISLKNSDQSSRQEIGTFIVDVNDYKKSKSSLLAVVAREAAKRVSQTQKAEALLPMSSYERRIVHMELASFKEVQTESIGEGLKRRIVIKPL